MIRDVGRQSATPGRFPTQGTRCRASYRCQQRHHLSRYRPSTYPQLPVRYAASRCWRYCSFHFGMLPCDWIGDVVPTDRTLAGLHWATSSLSDPARLSHRFLSDTVGEYFESICLKGEQEIMGPQPISVPWKFRKKHNKMHRKEKGAKGERTFEPKERSECFCEQCIPCESGVRDSLHAGKRSGSHLYPTAQGLWAACI